MMDDGQFEILEIETLDGDTFAQIVNVPNIYSHHIAQLQQQERLNATGANNDTFSESSTTSTTTTTTTTESLDVNSISIVELFDHHRGCPRITNKHHQNQATTKTALNLRKNAANDPLDYGDSSLTTVAEGDLMDGKKSRSIINNHQSNKNSLDNVDDQQQQLLESKFSQNSITGANFLLGPGGDDSLSEEKQQQQQQSVNNQQKSPKLTDVDLLVNIKIRKKKQNQQNLVESFDDGDTTDCDYHPNKRIQQNQEDPKPEKLKCFQTILTMVANCKYKTLFGLNLLSKKTIIFPLILILSIIALVLLHNGSLNTRKTPTPKKFFSSQNPFITEFEFGQLQDLWNRLVQNEISFIIYYAPWDSDCIRARNEIEVVANHYGQQIFFGAINCWWPEGECRKYQNFKRFPHFVAYIRSEGEIEYKGPVLASYIIPFLDNILNPLIPIQNEGQLLDLRAQHDAVVMGYFDFNQSPNQPGGYRSYLTTSIKALVNDPWRTVVYTVVTNSRVASKLKIDLKKESSLIIYVGNTTEHFTAKYSKPLTLLSWIYSRAELAPTIKWMTPSGIKSKLLADYIRKMPAFILFTPRSFLLGISPYYDLLREIVLDYYNCDRSPIIRSLIHRNILRRRLLEERLAELEERCHELLDMKEVKTENLGGKKFHDNIDTCCHSQTVKWRSFGGRRHGMNKNCLCTSCVHISLPKCPAKCSHFDCLSTAARFLDEFDPNHVNNSAVYCNQIKNSYQPKYTPYYKIVTTCSGNLQESFGGGHHHQEIGVDGGDGDWWNHQNQHLMAADEKINRMIQEFETQHCRKLKLGMNYTDLNFPDTNEMSATNQNRKIGNLRANFTGLACRTNRTLKFMAFDSLLYQAFAESLGIDVFHVPHSTIALIIDPSKESVHVLNHEIVFEDSGTMKSTSKSSNDFSVPKNSYSKNAFIEFIKNFTDGTLPRFYRNQMQSSGYCDLKQKLIRNQSTNRSVICVPELNTVTFVNLILGKSLENKNRDAGQEADLVKFLDKDIIVMYYAPWCGFCSAIAHIYLDVARFFDFSDDIIFARINGDANDLPWEYTVDRYPTIIFFPAKKRSDSITYPASKEINQKNLFRFIVDNAQLSVRLRMSVLFCHRSCLQRNLLKNYFRKQSTLRHLKHFQNSLLLHKDLIRSGSGKNQHWPSAKKQRQLERHLDDLRKMLRMLKRGQKRQLLLSHFILIKTIDHKSSNDDQMDPATLRQQLYREYFKSLHPKNQVHPPPSSSSSSSSSGSIKKRSKPLRPGGGSRLVADSRTAKKSLKKDEL